MLIIVYLLKIPAESLFTQLLIWFSQISGAQGAVNIVKLLKSRGVKLLYVLDEGLTIMDGVVDGLIGAGAL